MILSSLSVTRVASVTTTLFAASFQLTVSMVLFTLCNSALDGTKTLTNNGITCPGANSAMVVIDASAADRSPLPSVSSYTMELQPAVLSCVASCRLVIVTLPDADSEWL